MATQFLPVSKFTDVDEILVLSHFVILAALCNKIVELCEKLQSLLQRKKLSQSVINLVQMVEGQLDPIPTIILVNNNNINNNYNIYNYDKNNDDDDDENDNCSSNCMMILKTTMTMVITVISANSNNNNNNDDKNNMSTNETRQLWRFSFKIVLRKICIIRFPYCFAFFGEKGDFIHKMLLLQL